MSPALPAASSFMSVSVTIITFNEEQNIGRALESVQWADEIVVVDSGSSDRTLEIARTYTDKVYVYDWPGYAAQKQRAVELASHDWVLSIDADEVVTPELKQEILRVLEHPASDGYYISRLNYYLGYPIYHSGWAPDYQLRLFRKDKGRWRGAYVHESLHLDGVAGYLKSQLEHYSIQSLSAHHQRLDRYTTLAAEEIYSRGKSVGYGDLLLRPVATFLRNYVFKLGFLDGMAGLVVCYFSAYYVFLKFAKCWELSRSGAK